jgi:hypothetical protein
MKFPFFDEIFPPGVVTVFIGEPQAGKSYYTYETAYALARDLKERTKTNVKPSVLFLSTEKPTSFTLDLWDEILSKKYETEINRTFRFIPNALSLLSFLGVVGSVEVGTKTEFSVESANYEKSPLTKYLLEQKPIAIIVDSLTAPFDNLAAGGRQNLPLRAQVEEIFFNYYMACLSLSPSFPYLLNTSHITFNPTNPYEIREHIRQKGGKIIQHYSEIVYAFEVKDRPHGYRIAHVVRYPNIGAYDKSYHLLITSEGWKPATLEEIEKLKADFKKK